LIWSSGSVKVVHHHTEKEMQKEIELVSIKARDADTTVDGIKFEMRALFAYLIKAFSIGEEVKWHIVEISITVNGAKLDSNTHHVTIGFKLWDKISHYPISGKFLFPNEAGMSDSQHLDNKQSGAWCFPIIAVLAKDNNDTYEKCLRAIFEFGQELRTEGCNDNCEGLKQF
jgi:hypothetical protein